MKKTVLRYGSYGGITLAVLFVLGLYIGQGLDYSVREVIGYTTMILSLSFIFFAIKHQRDKENEGIISFGSSLKIGVLISLIVALVFGVINLVYVEIINPEFTAEYYAHMVEKYRNSLSEVDFQAKLKELEAQKELFSSTFMSTLIMFMTVFVLGFIISLISALFLQRK
ncbi:DUF4199 domain-containing protein [Pseudotenacibaculum haliotis]|uniref:DUF4199 domain-containing protein n=1 Tax=Pseudotenacibaculum haliotis TaxID=1862138 RepID=A0ABW5LQB8_9FLAO